MKDMSLVYNGRVPPFDMLWAPRAQQISFLDAINHTSDPDIEAFVDGFYISQVPDCGDVR